MSEADATTACQPPAWKTYKVGDVVTLEYGRALLDYRTGEGAYEVFGTNGKIGFTDSFLYDKPSLVIGRKGAYRGVHLALQPFFVIDTAFFTKTGDIETDVVFLYYWFKCIDINAIDSGSAIPSTSRDEIYDIDILLPGEEEQKAIATTLRSIDEKIDLLHRQNKTLEAIAEMLFRQWFVEQADQAWETRSVGDVLTIKGGTTPSTNASEFWDGEIPWTSPRDLANTQSVYLFDTAKKITPLGLAQIGSGLLPPGTVLLSSRAPIGYLTITDIPVAINQGYIAMICDGGISNYFAYLWCKCHMDAIKAAGNGSTFEEISKSSFKALPIQVPPSEKLATFNGFASNIFHKLRGNALQIHQLARIRDALLPKLMSGEVRVVF